MLRLAEKIQNVVVAKNRFSKNSFTTELLRHGLSLNYDNVKSYGGKLTVESDVYTCTEFKIILPTNK